MNDVTMRQRLAELDPAADLPPLGRQPLAGLLDRASADTGRPQVVRRRWWAVAGAATAATVAAVVLFAVVVPASQQGGAPALSTATLTTSDDRLASCAPLTEVEFMAAGLRTSTLAVAGTVRSVDDARVVVDVRRTYRGAEVDRVVLDLPPVDAEDGVYGLEVGQPVLVAGADGRAFGCGLTGPVSTDLQAVYDTAFNS